MSDKILLFSDLVSIFPLALCLSLLYNFLINPKRNLVDLILFISIIVSNKIVDLIKNLPYTGKMYEITRRPKGSGNCDYLSRNGPSEPNANGFPSGHMTSVSLFAMFMIFSKYYVSNYSSIIEFIMGEYLFIIINLGVIVLTAFARYYKKCHSIIQICAGTVFGSLIGIALSVILIKGQLIKIKDNRILKGFN